jgi:S1-C subfamily serine protease
MGYGPVETTIAFISLALVIVGSFAYKSSLSDEAASGPPWLGISGDIITPNVGATLNLKTQQGFLVFAVEPDGPADKAGIKGGNQVVIVDRGGTQQQFITGGDIITSIDDRQILQTNDIPSIIQSKKVGDIIDATIIRNDGSVKAVKVTLEAKPLGK